MTDRFVDRYLLFQLAAVSHSCSAEFYDHLKKYGLSGPKWRILLNVVHGPGMYISELATYCLLEQSHVTKLTDQLCQEKLTEKRVSNADRRRVRVHITERGRTTVLPLIEAAKIHEEKVLSRLSPSDAKRLKAILAILVDQHFKKAVTSGASSTIKT